MPQPTPTRPLADYLAGAYYSAIEIVPDLPHPGNGWRLFEYSRSMQMPESDRLSEGVHTNLPRSGMSGLPRDWEHVVVGWRARIDDDEEQPAVRAWLHSTSAVLQYREKFYYNAPLSELVRGEPRIIKMKDAEVLLSNDQAALDAMVERFGMQIVHMQENLAYRVQLDGNAKATEELRAYLRNAKRTLTLWVYLDGLMLRPVV